MVLSQEELRTLLIEQELLDRLAALVAGQQGRPGRATLDAVLGVTAAPAVTALSPVPGPRPPT